MNFHVFRSLFLITARTEVSRLSASASHEVWDEFHIRVLEIQFKTLAFERTSTMVKEWWLQMNKRFFSSVAFFVLLSLDTQAATDNDLCAEVKDSGNCSPIEFTAGLPRDDYESTLLSISKFIEDDFKFYLTESHGPFSKNKTPPIDYEVEFFSAVSRLRTH